MRIKKKSLAGRILIALCALVVLAAAVKIVLVNVKYPEPREVPIQKDETVTFMGVDITYTDSHVDTLVNTCQWLGIDVPLAFYSCYMGEDDIEDIAVFCMEVTFQNNTSETQSIYPYYFNLMQGDFAATLDDTLYTEVNTAEHFKITLEPGEKTERLLTFTLFAYRFSEERWANILDLDYTVLFGLYPEKIYFVA